MTQRYNARDFISRFTNLDGVELFKVLEELPPLGADGPWLAGGAIRRTLIGQPLTSDLDFFFRNEEQLNDFRKKLSAKGARQTAQNEHSETYCLKILDKDRFIQLVRIGFYDSPEAVIDTFDFTITQLAFDGTDLIVGRYTLWDLARKRLALHRLTYGVATIRRLLKYTNGRVHRM